MSTAEHLFAPYIRTLGKGRQGMRDLSGEEAHDAMARILAGEVEDLQLGAFLMLMRVKEESPAEVAGFVKAIREWLPGNPANVADVDWSSYAGKRRQHPWFVLAALLLAANGIRVFMHGLHRDDERLYTPEVLRTLGIPLAGSIDEAVAHIQQRNFGFVDLASFAPRLNQIIEMRRLLGLRSPMHTVARMINPLRAPLMVQGIFHPGYREMHQEAGALMGQPRLVVLKGDGGEAERNPDDPCVVKSVRDGELVSEEWPAMFPRRHVRPDELNPGHLRAVWERRSEDEYGEAAVVGTAAIVLRALDRAADMGAAEALARRMWEERQPLSG